MKKFFGVFLCILFSNVLVGCPSIPQNGSSPTDESGFDPLRKQFYVIKGEGTRTELMIIHSLFRGTEFSIFAKKSEEKTLCQILIQDEITGVSDAVLAKKYGPLVDEDGDFKITYQEASNFRDKVYSGIGAAVLKRMETNHFYGTGYLQKKGSKYVFIELKKADK